MGKYPLLNADGLAHFCYCDACCLRITWIWLLHYQIKK